MKSLNEYANGHSGTLRLVMTIASTLAALLLGVLSYFGVQIYETTINTNRIVVALELKVLYNEAAINEDKDNMKEMEGRIRQLERVEHKHTREE